MIHRAAELEVGLIDADEAGTVGSNLANRVGRDFLTGRIVRRAQPNKPCTLRLLGDRREIQPQRRAGEWIDEVELGTRHPNAGGVQLVGRTSDDGTIAPPEREPGGQQDRFIATGCGYDAGWIDAEIAGNRPFEWRIIGLRVRADGLGSDRASNARPP